MRDTTMASAGIGDSLMVGDLEHGIAGAGAIDARNIVAVDVFSWVIRAAEHGAVDRQQNCQV